MNVNTVFLLFISLQADAGDEDEDGHAEGGKRKQGRKKPSYTGGLVLEPKRGK